MNIELLYTGLCWHCGITHFKESLRDVAGADNVLDVISWYRQVNAQLEAAGWHFLLDEGGTVRAYCKHCWSMTEG